MQMPGMRSHDSRRHSRRKEESADVETESRYQVFERETRSRWTDWHQKTFCALYREPTWKPGPRKRIESAGKLAQESGFGRKQPYRAVSVIVFTCDFNWSLCLATIPHLSGTCTGQHRCRGYLQKATPSPKSSHFGAMRLLRQVKLR